MRIGVPKEVKIQEYRVGLLPAGVSALVGMGHEVVVESNAGLRIGYPDEVYREAGAWIAPTPEAAWDADFVIKVKEPQPQEYDFLRHGQLLFTYLHLAPAPDLTKTLLEHETIGIAYETVTDAHGSLPLLTPMSEVAGRLSVQAGATALQMIHGGNGTLLGGVPGVAPGRVLILGGGVVGTQAARMALGLGADVSILDINLQRLRQLDDLFGPRLKTRYADHPTLEALSRDADLLIGAVLIPGRQAPKLISREMVHAMKPGAVLVDVAIDQGGCAETSRPTTHEQPTYIEEGVVHYCVSNMPGAVARTSTQALTQATLPYVLEIAGKDWTQALHENAGLLAGLNVFRGMVTNRAVAEDLGFTYMAPEEALKQALP